MNEGIDAPSPPTLTAWEAKEGVALLERETDEQRQRRGVAQDPNTTDGVLSALTDTALQERAQNRFAWFRHLDEARKQRQATGVPEEDPTEWKRAPWRQSELLLQAIAAHPNTPPSVLIELIGTAPLIARITGAFFRNPIVPLLLLEQPDFLSRMDGFCQLLLLREETALPLFVQMLANDNGVAQEDAAQAAARMHISAAGEVTEEEVERAVQPVYWKERWGVITPYSRTHKWQALLLPERAESPRCTDRLEAASRVEATNAPLRDDFYERSGLDLLHYLTRDGNRFVRWKAQRQLAERNKPP